MIPVAGSACSLDLTIEIPNERLKVGDEFVAEVKIASSRTSNVTVTFADPLLKERPFSEIPTDTMLTLEPHLVPTPFELTPTNRSSSFPVLIRVDKLGSTELVTSLSYTGAGGVQGTLTAAKTITASPFDVTVEVTPKQTVLNKTAAKKKTERCRIIEAERPAIQNCIEIRAKVKNISDKTITSIDMPDADQPLKLINGTDPENLSEPLELIEAELKPPALTLQPGEEVTWVWRMNAFDAPAPLIFQPTVFGVMSGREVGGHGEKKFAILEDVLLKWGMRPTGGQTGYVAGNLIKADGYIENVSAADGGDGEQLLVQVYALHEGNAGGGYVVPGLYQGPPAEQEHFFDLPHEPPGNKVTTKALFNTYRTRRASEGTVGFGVRLWVVNDDGTLTDTDDQVEFDEDFWADDEFKFTLAGDQIPAETYRAECVASGVSQFMCGGTDKLLNDTIPGLKGMAYAGFEGLKFFGEMSARQSVIQAKRDHLALRSVMDDPVAKNALLEDLHSDYVELHQQQVLAGHVIGSLPKAFGEFSNETLASFSKYLIAIEEGNIADLQYLTGEFFGANPDLLLEPLMVARGVMKLRRAMLDLQDGTAENLFSASVLAYSRRQTGDVDARQQPRPGPATPILPRLWSRATRSPQNCSSRCSASTRLRLRGFRRSRMKPGSSWHSAPVPRGRRSY